MLRTFILLFALLLSQAAGAQITSQQSATRQYVYPVTTLATGKTDIYYGSAVVLTPKFALSSAHIFEGTVKLGGEIHLLGRDNTKKKLTIVKYDRKKDLVLLTGDLECPCAQLGEPPGIDQTIIVVGYPYHSYYDTQFLTLGYVQKVTTDQITSTAFAAPGNSGGGAFVEQDGLYRLVGIQDSIATQTIPTTYGTYKIWLHAITFSTSITTIKDFLYGAGTPAR